MLDKNTNGFSLANIKEIQLKVLWQDIKEAISGTERDFTKGLRNNYSYNKMDSGEYAGAHWLASFAVYALKASQ